jgi:hypothetical protein
MRNVTANAAAQLALNTGTELMVILEVEWVDNGSVFYSDQDVDGCQAKILEMGGFDTSMILEGSSDTQELNVILDDTDDSLRAIYNSVDTHKRPARVYMLHKGLTLADKILVFKGELVTPIEWNETQRSVSFNVMSKLDATQVGFSMEEGDFPNIPEEALGKAWPLAFGKVCHLPAVKVRAPRRGYLEGGVGISDFTLPERICQALKIQCPSQATGKQTQVTIINGVFSSNQVDTVGPDLECVNRRFGEICRLRDLLTQQVAFEYDNFSVYNGVSFPQGEKTTIYVDGASFIGTFTGNTFNITSRQHPEWATFNHQYCRQVPTLAYGMTSGVPQYGGNSTAIQGAGGYYTIADATGTPTKVWVPTDNQASFTANQNQAQAYASCDEALITTPGMIGGPKDSWAYYDAMDETSFFWAPAGTEVYTEAESEILYIVSLIPGTVDGVAAFRTAPNGFRYLTEVPSDYYTVYETDYEGYTVTEVGLDKALSLYNDQWEDQIYVSFTSSVGPNPCDIIEWLVNKYTSLTIDSATFADVHTALTNYPTNFYLTRRPDVFDLITDIAYQSRCSVYVRNGVVYIKYLSTEPTSERTLSESDILSDSFIESLSETEEVYTTHNISWQTGGAAVRSDQDVERKIILKYNVDKYGTVEDSWDYFCHNIYELALKTSTFWLIRKANSWKRLDFKLPLKHMDLDVGDCVTINVARFSSTPVKVIIEAMNLNPDDYTIDVSCWTPIRSGETEPYYWAWPSQQSVAQTWPLAGDTHGGSGTGISVTPPTDHILLGGSHRDDQIIITSGDLHPSDLDDTLPLVFCELSDYWNFDEKPPEIIAKEIAQSSARQAMESNITGGGNPGGVKEEKEERDECGEGGGGCNYKVKNTWHTSSSQGQATSLGGPAVDDSGPCGGPCKCLGGCPSCTGPQWQVCHTFGTAWGAKISYNNWRQEFKKSTGDYWKCGETAIILQSIMNGKHEGPFAADCERLADATDPGDGTATGETAQPTGLTGNEGYVL